MKIIILISGVNRHKDDCFSDRERGAKKSNLYNDLVTWKWIQRMEISMRQFRTWICIWKEVMTNIGLCKNWAINSWQEVLKQ